MKNHLEVRRQIFHILLGLVIVFLLIHNFLTPFRILLLIVFGFVLSILSRKFKIPVIHWFLKNFERPENLKTFPGKGIISFFAGVLLVLAIRAFSRDIALASIMILTLSDSVSHLVGRFLGKLKHPLNGLKKLEGSVIGVVAGGLGALFFVNIKLAFLGALVAMILEAIEVKMNGKIVDDNILVPLVAATTMHLINIKFWLALLKYFFI